MYRLSTGSLGERHGGVPGGRAKYYTVGTPRNIWKEEFSVRSERRWKGKRTSTLTGVSRRHLSTQSDSSRRRSFLQAAHTNDINDQIPLPSSDRHSRVSSEAKLKPSPSLRRSRLAELNRSILSSSPLPQQSSRLEEDPAPLQHRSLQAGTAHQQSRPPSPVAPTPNSQLSRQGKPSRQRR